MYSPILILTLYQYMEQRQPKQYPDLQLSSISSQKTEDQPIYQSFNQYLYHLRKSNDQKRKLVIQCQKQSFKLKAELVTLVIVKSQLNSLDTNPEVFIKQNKYNKKRTEEIMSLKRDESDIKELNKTLNQVKQELIIKKSKIMQNQSLSEIQQQILNANSIFNELEEQQLNLHQILCNLKSELFEKKLIKNELFAKRMDYQERQKLNQFQHLKQGFINRDKLKKSQAVIKGCQQQFRNLALCESNQNHEIYNLTKDIQQNEKQIQNLQKAYATESEIYDRIIQDKQKYVTSHSIQEAERISGKYDNKIQRYSQLCREIIDAIRIRYPKHQLPSLDQLIFEMSKNLQRVEIDNDNQSKLLNNFGNEIEKIDEEHQPSEMSQMQRNSGFYS